MYTLNDYYHNSIPDDLEYWDYDEEQRQIELCYEKYQLHKDVEALIEERSWQVSFRYMSIQRIAREAREKKVSYTLIFKFFKEYELQSNDNLMRLPEDLRDYIMLHELCHLRYLNHGPEFHALLESLCPEHRSLQKRLRAYKLI